MQHLVRERGAYKLLSWAVLGVWLSLAAKGHPGTAHGGWHWLLITYKQP